MSLEICIKESIFETNQLLTCKEKISLIEYASFYGSNDIIKYIEKKGVELTSSMWIYGIHSCNAELIRYLEDNHVSPPDNDYERILEESIKCHHNDISNYLIDNIMNEEYLQNNIENEYYHNLYRYATESYNYCFFPTNMKYKNMFFYLCEFDYYTLVKLYLTEGTIDINAKIKHQSFKCHFKSKTFIKFKSNFFHDIDKLNDLWNLTRTFNRTALIRAAKNGHKESVELLISQSDIDINIQDILNQKHS